MNWQAKVFAFKLLSALPGGSALYRFGQEHVTRSLVPTRARVNQKLEVGIQYLNQFGQSDGQLNFNSHLDFGTGWHPTIPLLYYGLGVERQYLFDVVPVLDGPMVQSTVDTVLSIITDPAWPHRHRIKRWPKPPGETPWKDYLRDMGITYHAPYAETFPSLEGKLDIVTSTQVLLHIPREPMQWCFKEIHRCLKPGGAFLATVHLRDLFAESQPGLSKYNHLRYSREQWERWINSPMMSFNRFRAPDYRQLLEEAGFKIAHFQAEAGTQEDLKELAAIPIARCFEHYTREELAAKHLFFAAQKR